MINSDDPDVDAKLCTNTKAAKTGKSSRLAHKRGYLKVFVRNNRTNRIN